MSTPDLAGFGPADLPDLSGLRAVVTGANSGIGFHAAKALAEHGAEVTIACRSLDRARSAQSDIGHGVQVAELDLASLDSVGRFADGWTGPLDLLVDNAGVMAPPRYRETSDGFELQFGTNHLGHAALTGRLMPRLLEAAAPRVVVVSSIAHHQGDESVLAGNANRAAYSASQAYGNSKLANLLFAFELQRRAAAAGSPLTVTACHPGVSNTGLVTSKDGLGGLPLVKYVAPVVGAVLTQSSAAGANPTLWAATYAEPGSYVGPTGLRETRGRLGAAKLSRHARDTHLAAQLWDRAEEWTGVRFDLG
ncbi:oxidoreductase [Nocardioides sp. CFH 31398]|uniref:oxidoreductase n=1 Tax=Nocardioides sp. CFH 31398 TaxID=2919579 RepID=UPI001F05C75D|nr:oxidoreductase [Nocardioides sp. CFH 31398]MCH1867436.1 oxidoreductase [Nocardioides sp. CFH 31398]